MGRASNGLLDYDAISLQMLTDGMRMTPVPEQVVFFGADAGKPEDIGFGRFRSTITTNWEVQGLSPSSVVPCVANLAIALGTVGDDTSALDISYINENIEPNVPELKGSAVETGEPFDVGGEHRSLNGYGYWSSVAHASPLEITTPESGQYPIIQGVYDVITLAPDTIVPFTIGLSLTIPNYEKVRRVNESEPGSSFSLLTLDE